MRIQLLHHSHAKQCFGRMFHIVDCDETLARQWIAVRGAREVAADMPLTNPPKANPQPQVKKEKKVVRPQADNTAGKPGD